MNVTTKFDLGESVFAIRSRQEEYNDPCGFCGASGRIEGSDGTVRPCPECYGLKGRRAWRPAAWLPESEMTVGQVRLRIGRTNLEEEYMLVETGVGSGTNWRAADLFASRGEARDECLRRNAGPALVALVKGDDAMTQSSEHRGDA